MIIIQSMENLFTYQLQYQTQTKISTMLFLLLNFLILSDKGKLLFQSQGLKYLKKPIVQGDINRIPSSIILFAR